MEVRRPRIRRLLGLCLLSGLVAMRTDTLHVVGWNPLTSTYSWESPATASTSSPGGASGPSTTSSSSSASTPSPASASGPVTASPSISASTSSPASASGPATASSSTSASTSTPASTSGPPSRGRCQAGEGSAVGPREGHSVAAAELGGDQLIDDDDDAELEAARFLQGGDFGVLGHS